MTRLDIAADIPRLAAALPPFPAVIVRLLELFRHDDANLDVLARLARNDPVISAKILSSANHVRRLRAQSDLADPFAATSLIGIDRVRAIVIASGMNRFLSQGKGAAFFFDHSLAVAIVSQELAMLSGVAHDAAYVAGILHDVGQLCFHVLDERAFLEAYERSAADGRLMEHEATAFGMDHCRSGALLAEYWNLPAEITDAIRTHHDDTLVTGKLQAVVCLGETLTRALDMPPSPKNRVTRLNAAALEILGLSWDQPEMADCFGRCRARFRHALNTLSI